MKVGPSGTTDSFEPPKKNKMKMSANFINIFARKLREHAKKESVTEMTQREVKPTDQPPLQEIVEKNIK